MVYNLKDKLVYLKSKEYYDHGTSGSTGVLGAKIPGLNEVPGAQVASGDYERPQELVVSRDQRESMIQLIHSCRSD